MYVHVNAAVSVDGKLSSRRREQVRISGADDFDRVDRIRAAADAVLVGVGTVLADDPHLTLDEEDRRVQRLRDGRSGNPTRVVVDSRARTPTDARVLDDEATTYLLVSDEADRDRLADLRDAGAEVIVAGGDDGRVDLRTALDALEREGIERVMVEGGGEVIASLFDEDLVDELTLYVGSLVIGGRDAPTLADGEGFVEDFPRLDLVDVARVDDGVLLSYET
ncbi:2,5-diamino-6-(ribosylamino)-4(3H)-pyrimidinone 5'-phosphate reductase [Halobaculum sp. WSA2]|uniref:2,5-diamino-6-(ribosylamino)-4(3H)-pyrimidinone 5'-phosphate reductase n=1 Tax=Halobaculum saliterrae TaxID=2073113 RepID=A0A6B0SUA7_9EURY|nr:2,5-diamino-6-(ribosylamino)-4(3H)-pyrimidinone 5'-phosphate reductase [Halobaculum saliterrae]MXR42157.1 2,5-diamino-6-(ribosylamino)-4(3H)-pyrimidinone 5'-phosphate reductase [Halobaculum saliterrae]